MFLLSTPGFLPGGRYAGTNSIYVPCRYNVKPEKISPPEHSAVGRQTEFSRAYKAG
jgi:hypothetical protein